MILVVDDEIDIREILQFNLEYEGYKVDLADSAEKAMDILSPCHELIILDVMMGGMSVFKFTDQLRKAGNNIPIIFLTTKNTENDMLTGFSIGGDDFIAKPFSIKEVIARVKSILKRSNHSTAALKNIQNIFTKNELTIELHHKTAAINNKNIEFTKTEFDILSLFVQNEGRIFQYEEVLAKVWKELSMYSTFAKKLGNVGKWITNRTGYGYTFNVPEN